jgi:hypothetical protein
MLQVDHGEECSVCPRLTPALTINKAAPARPPPQPLHPRTFRTTDRKLKELAQDSHYPNSHHTNSIIMSKSLDIPHQHAPAFLNLTGDEPVRANLSTPLPAPDHLGHQFSAVAHPLQTPKKVRFSSTRTEITPSGERLRTIVPELSGDDSDESQPAASATAAKPPRRWWLSNKSDEVRTKRIGCACG